MQNPPFSPTPIAMTRNVDMGARKLRNGARHSAPTLATLATRATLRALESACKSPRNVASSAALRAACAATVPRSLRQRLLEELLRTGRIYNTLQLYAFDVLLAPDIARLAVRHVRRWYRARFLELLASGRAAGLEILLFEDITWLTGDPATSAPFSAALAALPNLRQVSFRFVCDDLMLDSLGRSCPRLEEIDASGAMAVTDFGVQRLCIKGYANLTEEAQRRASGKGPWSAVKRFVRSVFFDCFLETALDEQTSLPTWWRSSVIRRARKNLCCDTLRIVNLTSTRVTSLGIDVVRSSVPSVKVISTTLLRTK